MTGFISQIKNSIAARFTSALGRHPTEATVIRAASGAPVVVHRRGTVLVLVLGILALMAIIVVVYTTIGQGDRRATAALIRSSKIDDQSTAISDYISRIIGKDTFKGQFAYDGAYLGSSPTGVIPGNSSEPRFIRAATTAPSVLPVAMSVNPTLLPGGDRTTRSNLVASNMWPFLLFNVEGSVRIPWIDATTDTRADPRYATTPWLASSEPTWLRLSSPTLNPTDATQPWRDRKDWQNFSIIAPSGNAVNLATLRGNFAAESGIGLDATGAPRLTSNLTLFDATGNPTTMLGDGTRQADLNFPADWFTNQQGTFRSIIDTARAPGDVRYLLNQFCDADGDGYVDGRWQELVSITDPQNPRSLISSTPNLRLFVGARIVDLSGKVNVNTATQFRTAPSIGEPAGATPADVDLERLLSMTDFSPPFYTANPVGYELLAQPQRTYALNGANSAGGNYAQPANYSNFAFDVGAASFSAIIDGRIPGIAPAPNQPYAPNSVRRESGPFLAQENYFGQSDLEWFAGDRSRSYLFSGSSPSGASLFESTTGATPNVYIYQASYGPGDELELRTNERMNNPSVLSRLEIVAGGRLAGYKNFSPLRENRNIELEKLSRIPQNLALLQAEIDVRQRLTCFSGARPLISADVTGSEHALVPGSETKIDINELLGRIRGGGRGGQQPVTDRARAEAANQLFKIACDALAPFSFEPMPGTPDVNIAWTSASAGGSAVGMQMRPLAYGGDVGMPGATGLSASQQPFSGIAAERAIRLAAHWTANLIDGRESFEYYTQSNGQPIFPGDWASEFMVRFDGSEAFTRFLETLPRYGGAARNSELFPAFVGNRSGTVYSTDYYDDQRSGQRPRMSVALALDPSRLAPPLTPGSTSVFATSSPIPAAAGTPLAQDINQITAQAINVYGIKPQAFITQMSSLTVYSDTERDIGENDIDEPAGPDGDDPRDGNNPPDPLNNPPARPDQLITIHGRVSEANPDYICEIVAFQLHNPFDTNVYLSKYDNNEGVPDNVSMNDPKELRHYMEFGGKYYALADASDRSSWTTKIAKTVVLGPGETRTFYIIDQPPERIEDRLRRVDPSLSAENAKAALDGWIRGQFSSSPGAPNADPIRLPEIDMVNLELKDPPAASDVGILNDTANPLEIDKFRQARLWKMVRTNASETPGAGAAENDIHNDILVDRLRDPAAPTVVSLDQRLPARQNTIEGSNSQPANNSGLSIAMWGNVRRPSLPATISLADLPRGVLPPWCVEVKSTLPAYGDGAGDKRWWRAENVRSLNKDDKVAADGNNLKWANFNGTTYGARRLTGLVTPGRSVEPSFAVKPHAQNGNELSRINNTLSGAQPGTNLSGEIFPFIQVPLILPPPASGSVPADTKSLGQAYANAFSFEAGSGARAQRLPQAPPLRPTDMLATLAIGPYKNSGATIQIPSGTQLPLDDVRCLDVQWTTLAEAAALALDYDSPAEVRDPEYRLGAVVTDLNPVEGCLNRGQLVPDRFIPYTDRASGTPGIFDVPTDANRDGVFEGGDVARNRGLPFVVSLVDRFKTTKYGSINQPIFGTVNISTASLAVKRLLPMLTPDVYGWMGVDPAGFDGTTLNDPFDVATTLDAYGNLTRADSRKTAGSSTPIPVSFRTDNYATPFNPTVADPSGRAFATGLFALRNQPGFAAAAEVLVANLADIRFGETTVAVNILEARRRMSMNRLGRDGEAFSVPIASGNPAKVDGLLPIAYRTGTAGLNGHPPLTISPVKDDPTEAYALANALLGTISVRSDFFCVWFVVQGFQPSDVEGLEPWTGNGTPPDEDRYRAPMSPSVQRRYVMVVDRSNVVSEGDKPRILMLEEVPAE